MNRLVAILFAAMLATSCGAAVPRMSPAEIRQRFRGSVCNLLTPFFHNESLDLSGVSAQISSCVLEANTSVVLLTSADSGFSYMNESEVLQLTRHVVRSVRAMERRPTVVVAAAPVSITSRVLSFAHAAKAAGADVLMVRPPTDVLPTNGNEGSHKMQRGLVELYTAAAKVMPLQIVGCHASLSFEVLDAVAAAAGERFCCYKIENGNSTYTAQLLRRPSLADVAFMYGGGAATAFIPPLHAVGAGITSGFSVLAQGIAPAQDREVWPAIRSGDATAFNKSIALQSALVAGLRSGLDARTGRPLSPLMSDGFPGGLEIGLRTALEVRGVSSRYLREPQDFATAAQVQVVRGLLRRLGLLQRDSLAGLSSARPLTMLTDPQARCMDGTLSGYYVHKSRNASQTNWVLSLQGGGECVSAKCKAKVSGPLGSSKFFPKTKEVRLAVPLQLTLPLTTTPLQFWNEKEAHLIDASCTGNPELCDYNLVWLPYCSQDLWTGNASAKSPAGSTAPGYYFSGNKIFGAVLDALEKDHGMANATQLVLSGESAGGFGVYANVDYLAGRFPKAKVVGAPIAGYEFYAWPYTGPGHTSSSLADFRASAMAGGAYNKLWSSVLPPGCLATHKEDPGACQLPCFSYPYVKAPLFIMEAQSDSVVLMYHDWLPNVAKRKVSAPEKAYMAAFAQNQSQCLARAMAPGSKDGVFNPSCLIHTGFQENFTIATASGEKIGYLAAFRRWLGAPGRPGESVKLADKCKAGEILCNPTCPLK